MPLSGENSPGVGELAYQLRDVLVRVDSLFKKLDEQYYTKELAKRDKELWDEVIRSLREQHGSLKTLVETHAAQHATKADIAEVAADVAELKDDKKWITRLIIGLVVVGVIGAYLAVKSSGG